MVSSEHRRDAEGVDLYTVDVDPIDHRTITLAFLVWASGERLDNALADLEAKATKGGATAVLGLRMSTTDGTYYIPAETFIGGGTTQRDMGSPGSTVERRLWTIYGTAVKRLGDPDQPPTPLEHVWNPDYARQLTEEAMEKIRRRPPRWP